LDSCNQHGHTLGNMVWLKGGYKGVNWGQSNLYYRNGLRAYGRLI
jgi:hypothetical protein